MSTDDGFYRWLARVDAALEAEVGLSTLDLPDQPFRDWYESGTSPAYAATLTLEDAGYPMDF